jgi:S-layer family protein
MRSPAASLVRSATLLVVMLPGATAFGQDPIFPKFLVNTYTTGDQTLPRAASTASGDFLVVWTDAGQDGSSFGAFAQAIADDGSKLGTEFRLNTTTTGDQVKPAIAISKNGRSLAAWRSVSLVPGQLFDPQRMPIGGEFQIAAYTTGLNGVPDVAARDDGTFIVAWSRDGVDGSGQGAVVRLVRSDGAPIGNEFIANAYTTGDQIEATVAANPADGNFLVVWTSAQPGDGSGAAIFGRRFDPAGAPVGGDFLVNTTTTGDQASPAVSVSRSGHAAVTWRTLGGSVYARAFDPSGVPTGPDFVVDDPPSSGVRSGVDAVSHDDVGNFVVVWSQSTPTNTIVGRRFLPDGARRDGPFALFATTLDGAGNTPVVTSDDVGNYLVLADRENDGSFRAIGAERFGGLRPRRLEVDAPGNGVLEPGESVQMKPWWANVRNDVTTVDGVVRSFTGPTGFSYAIVAANSLYGSVAPGQLFACSQCPFIQVSDPPVRPQTHVDASALEAIVPNDMGQQKGWTVHIGRSFGDVAVGSPFYRFIETLLHHGVTGGCSATTYCPGASTMRAQMAVFAIVGKDGTGHLPPACGPTPMFNDVPVTSSFCPWIEELARRGVVSGCGGGNYCPTAPVTREQMAVFVLRTLDPALSPPACGATPIFSDVPPSSPFCRWVEELARRSVVSGCGGGNYCPAAAVTREQMAVFIAVTFGLTLYGV